MERRAAHSSLYARIALASGDMTGSRLLLLLAVLAIGFLGWRWWSARERDHQLTTCQTVSPRGQVAHCLETRYGWSGAALADVLIEDLRP